MSGGRKIRSLKALFPRVNRETAPPASPEPLPEKAAAAQAAASPDTAEGTVDLIDIATFTQVDLRVAVISAAEAIPKADRLLRLQIDLGSESRQLVAGIAKFYAPEDLPGRRIVVVANLKPATLRGVESQGMLLAAKSGRRLALVTVDDDSIPPGSPVG